MLPLISLTSLNWICLNSLGDGIFEVLCLKLEILWGLSGNCEGTLPFTLDGSFNECLRWNERLNLESMYRESVFSHGHWVWFRLLFPDREGLAWGVIKGNIRFLRMDLSSPVNQYVLTSPLPWKLINVTSYYYSSAVEMSYFQFFVNWEKKYIFH